MNLEDTQRVYFIGIGGIGMSALARWFKRVCGIPVIGYDRIETELTQALVKEGIAVHYEDSLSQIENDYLAKEGTLVIYTPAIPKDHEELNYFKACNYEIQKRSEVLGLLTKHRFTIAVAGTHGKTSTTSMIAHLLSGTPNGCTAFVGGIMTSVNSNLVTGKKNAPIVVEADEYARSFMQLHPDVTVITSLDADHLDIYGNEANMLDTYEAFVKKTNVAGIILINSRVAAKINIGNKHLSYALQNGDIKAENLRIVNGNYIFNYRHGMKKIANIRLKVPGQYNVENALAAIAVALEMGMEEAKIRERMNTYPGVKRRFQYIFKSPKVNFIDDYAHHPQEIEALLASVRSLYPDRKVTAIFQPHLFSRTNDFKEGFATALDKADEIILLEIYPAREEPMKGVTSRTILDLMKNTKKALVGRENLIAELDARKLDVVLTIGAGDIDKEIPKIAGYIKKRYGATDNKMADQNL